MITLPEWDKEFIARTQRRTRRGVLYAAARTLVLLLVPWGLAATAFLGAAPGAHPYTTILLFFCLILLLRAAEVLTFGVKRRRTRWMVYRLLDEGMVLLLLCPAAMFWWLVFPGHVALAIGAWWLFGLSLVFGRYGARCWALREAVLQTKDYQLFGRRTGRFLKRVKHDKACLYHLPDDSAFSRHTIMTLVSDMPLIYVGSEARRILDPDELRVLIAHELGHSCSKRYAGYELADYVRRLFLVPLLVSAGSTVLVNAGAGDGRQVLFLFLTALVLIWQVNRWASYLLGRPVELGADLYAVEVTNTPAAFVNAMVKFADTDPYNVLPNLFDRLGFFSHPCIAKRLDHVKAAREASEDKPASRRRRRGKLRILRNGRTSARGA